MSKQRTIEKEVSLSGVGLHTGNKVNIKFKPAEVDSGISFIRIDIPDKPVIKATLDMLMSASNGPRRTAIGVEQLQICTVEHLLATLSGLGIDNLEIEIDSNEVPGADGSGKVFYDALTQAGIKEQKTSRECYFIKEPLFVNEGNATIIVLPSSEFKVSYTLDYDHPKLQNQFFEMAITEESFRDEIVEARTFCLENETDELIKNGLGKGANYDNTLVVGKDGVVKNNLRFDNEFARHKVLDLIGDLSLIGLPLKGHFIALRSGHSANLKLLKKISEQKTSYSLATTADHSKGKNNGELGVEDIKKILPHRDPFLFVDKILSLEIGKRAVGVKYVRENDYFFRGHFPGRPIMPGVLIIEAMAQVGGVMMLAANRNEGKMAYFLACDKAKFRKTVVPGDELVMEVETMKLKSRTGIVRARAHVNNKLVTEADLMFALVD